MSILYCPVQEVDNNYILPFKISIDTVKNVFFFGTVALTKWYSNIFLMADHNSILLWNKVCLIQFSKKKKMACNMVNQWVQRLFICQIQVVYWIRIEEKMLRSVITKTCVGLIVNRYYGTTMESGVCTVKCMTGITKTDFWVEVKLENVSVSCKEIGMVKNKQTKAT